MSNPGAASTITTNYVGGGSPAQIGAASTDYVGFYGATPVVRPSGANQGAVATTAITTAVSTAATSTSPYGYATSTQADAIVAAVNSLISRVSATDTLVNQIRSDLVTLGLIKGAA